MAFGVFQGEAGRPGAGHREPGTEVGKDIKAGDGKLRRRAAVHREPEVSQSYQSYRGLPRITSTAPAARSLVSP